MLRFISRAGLLGAALGVATVGLATGGVASASPNSGNRIGPHQHFYGLVNGKPSDAALTEVCTINGKHAALLSGQWADVRRAAVSASTEGYTGNSSAIEVELAYAHGNIGVIELLGTLRHYGQKMTLGSNVSVPCGGTGVLSFTPTGSGGHARSYSITVSFDNVSAIGAGRLGALRPA